jgi:hypothetical protein
MVPGGPAEGVASAAVTGRTVRTSTSRPQIVACGMRTPGKTIARTYRTTNSAGQLQSTRRSNGGRREQYLAADSSWGMPAPGPASRTGRVSTNRAYAASTALACRDAPVSSAAIGNVASRMTGPASRSTPIQCSVTP